MERRRLGLVCLIGLLSVFATAFPARLAAQVWERLTNPSSDVTITHPPRIVLKNVSKLSVLEFRGDQSCGPELAARLTQSLAGTGKFEMVDRDNIQSILGEQGFQSSGAVSRQAAVKIGQMIGPVAVFTGRVTRCSSDIGPVLKDWTRQDKKGRVTTKYIRRATARMTASVSLIDMTTGKIYAGDVLDVADTIVNEAFNGYPEAPSEDAAISRMYQRAVRRILPMIVPWTEVVSVKVFDDNKCDLDRGAGQIKRGDVSLAAETMQAAIARSCNRPDDKGLLSKAYYNLGIALTYSDRPEDGLKALRTSLDLRDSGIGNDAMATVRRIIELKETQRIKQVNAIDLGASSRTASKAVASTQLTNRGVIDMVRARLSDAIIVKKIRSSSCSFDTEAPALIALKRAGASDAVVMAMTEAECR